MYILKYSDYLVLIHNPVNTHTIQCTYYSSHYIFSAHTTAAITSSVHILQQLLHLQCTHYSSYTIQCTLQPCTAMYSYLQPIFNAHCSQLQPSTTTYTTAIPSSAHYSYTIQCTLQPYYLVHTAATLSDANTIQCI